ncbi:hypothetical protein L1D24_03435 [Vibrio brasiliensis]|uniref:hypothetical protein n=1 Tax=Vibrio brasiliensis TaxID=170652 RepID=UPI001EFE1BA1|nr:hypothetical protein [Vibrio brasiliensis]MCG9647619.1 hypothetical protein [Vibrio brasiliensis]
MVEKISVVVSIFSFLAAVASAIAAFRSYKLSKNLAKICNLFPSVHDNRLIITATSTTERVIAHDIRITVYTSYFRNKTYSLTRLYNVNKYVQTASRYDAIFPTLFERGLVSGESYEFPITELFKIATNKIILQKKSNGLDPETLVVGQKVKVTFMFNGAPETHAFELSRKLLDEILSGETTFSNFKLKECTS